MRDTSWMDQRNCANVDPELFTSTAKRDQAKARKVCEMCEVRLQCLRVGDRHAYHRGNVRRTRIWQAEEVRQSEGVVRALDLFAGAGGWDLAARELDIECHGIEIMPEARDTREANGLLTVGQDVWTHAEWLTRHPHMLPAYDGLIASPPCQTFSMAGKGAGRKALDDVLMMIDFQQYKDVAVLRKQAEILGDERTALVLTPLLFWHHMRPKWVAFEQVPTVLPVWEAMADVMREAGYSVWTGNLHAEQYGVPQTRKRAILIAHVPERVRRIERTIYGLRSGEYVDVPWVVEPPTPTHSKYYPRDKMRLDPGVKPWVSMAEALGWSDVEVRSNYGTGGDPKNRGVRDAGEPSATVTEKVGRNYVQDRQLGQGRLVERHGKPKDRMTDEPSYSMRGQASGSAPGGGYVLTGREHERPATTIQGDARLAGPGHRCFEPGCCEGRDPESMFNGSASRRVTVEEAAILQGFPKDFVFCGGKGKQYLQVGNAIPPPLAKAILQSVTPSGKMNA